MRNKRFVDTSSSIESKDFRVCKQVEEKSLMSLNNEETKVKPGVKLSKGPKIRIPNRFDDKEAANKPSWDRDIKLRGRNPLKIYRDNKYMEASLKATSMPTKPRKEKLADNQLQF